MKKFEVGKLYSTRSICDHECIWEYVVIARTAKTITLKDTMTGEVLKRRIIQGLSEWNNCECVYPLGKYSMCPILKVA